MNTIRASVVFAVVVAHGGFAAAGNIDGKPFVVTCDTTVKVTDETAGGTLTLDPSDPILLVPCPKDGITITNSGTGAVDRTFTLDCQMRLGQANDGRAIAGLKKGIGVELAGPGLGVINCSVRDFKNGIKAKGNGLTIQDNRVTGSVGDGFVVGDSRGIKD